MTETKKRGWKYWVLTSFWIASAIGTVVLLVSAIRSRDSKGCKGIKINITGVNSNFFIDKKEIKNILTANGAKQLIGKRIPDFNLEKMEEVLEKNVWIKNAELFFDNNMVLQVKVEEREPVARIFTTVGTSFYIDKDGDRLPLSENFSARVPMFTSFPSNTLRINKADSILLQQVKEVSAYILNDPFWMAQIEQVDITADRQLEMIPKLGDHVIRFGEATDMERKFHQLYVFYQQVSNQLGWNKYSVIDIQYNNQVVVTKKGFAGETKLDSTQIKLLVKEMMNNNRQTMNDATLAVALSKPSVTPVLKSSSENAAPAADKPVIKKSLRPFDLSPKPKPKSTPALPKLMPQKNHNPTPSKTNKKPKPKAVMTKKG